MTTLDTAAGAASGAPERHSVMEPAAPTTVVPALDTPPVGPAPARLRASNDTLEDRIVEAGSLLAALSLAWVVCFRLLPWGTALAYALTALGLFVVVITVTTWVTNPGPMVADRLMRAVITCGAALVGVAVGSAILFVFVRGFGAITHWNMWTQDMVSVGPRDALSKGGVAHAMLGTLIQIAIAVAVTLPLGIGTAVFMTEVGGRFARVVRTVVEAMTALPSIVAGLFIYTTLIVWLGVPSSGLAAAAAIGVMILPIIARASDVVLRVVPSGLREASLALGASRWRTVWGVVLPTARPGLATALILGIARGVGETSPVLLTSGAAVFFVSNPVGGVMNSLPLFVYNAVRSGEPMMIDRGFGAAFILLTLVLVLFVVARRLARQRTGR